MLHNTIATANGKGGVGKTSITANTAGVLANSGWHVLAVDLDRQGNLEKDLGYRDHPDNDHGEMLFRSLTGDQPLSPVVRDVRPNLDVIPGGEQIFYADAGLARQGFDPRLLAAKLAPLSGDYDLIIVDCPPAGGIMTTLAMGAARGLVIPVKADDCSTEGLELVAEQFQKVRATANPDLQVLGVVIFALEAGATALRRTVRGELEAALGGVAPVFKSVIRHSARAAFDTRRAGELAHEYELVAASSKGERLKALRDPNVNLASLRHFSASADGLAGDYAALAEEIVARLSELADPDVLDSTRPAGGAVPETAPADVELLTEPRLSTRVPPWSALDDREDNQ
jgi:chromosome partitioning protein